jgi:hypothetical protein
MRRLTKVHTHQSGLLAADEQPRAWVVACGCPTEPHHTPSWVGGAVTREYDERRVGVAPKKKSFFLASNWRVRHREAQVQVDSLPGLNGDIHAAPHYRFRAQTLP